MNGRQGKEDFHLHELERRILHGLSCEWEIALDSLPSGVRDKIRSPLFSLQGMKDRWGTWHKEKREISLSRDLVFHHSWCAVREVLLHEMAHQLADEVLGACAEPPHGPKFQEACRELRANPRASGQYPTLDQRLSREWTDGKDKILSRVKKLMALAESPNRYEAEAAMTKAHGLIAKYNIDLLHRGLRQEYVSVFVGPAALRHPLEDYCLANLLQDFYFVQGIWVPAYVVEKGKMGRVLEISGTFNNIRWASYVHDFVRHFIRTQWNKYNRRRGLSRARQTDFATGIIEGFRSKLESLGKEEERTSTHALMKREDPDLKIYLAFRYPHTARISTGFGRKDPVVRKDGKQIGKNLVIAKGIETPKGKRGLLIAS